MGGSLEILPLVERFLTCVEINTSVCALKDMIICVFKQIYLNNERLLLGQQEV